MSDKVERETPVIHAGHGAGREARFELGVELEYNALRSEILKRIEMRLNIMSLTLTIAGGFLAVGLAGTPFPFAPMVLLAYPLLAAFLAFAWAQNDYRIRDIADYIRKELEARHPEMGWGWESYQAAMQRVHLGVGSWRYIISAHGGIFLTTQLAAIGIWAYYFRGLGLLEKLAWTVVPALSVLWVCWILWNVKRPAPSP
jgi:hypothetical protein